MTHTYYTSVTHRYSWQRAIETNAHGKFSQEASATNAVTCNQRRTFGVTCLDDVNNKLSRSRNCRIWANLGYQPCKTGTNSTFCRGPPQLLAVIRPYIRNVHSSDGGICADSATGEGSSMQNVKKHFTNAICMLAIPQASPGTSEETHT